MCAHQKLNKSCIQSEQDQLIAMRECPITRVHARFRLAYPKGNLDMQNNNGNAKKSIAIYSSQLNQRRAE